MPVLFLYLAGFIACSSLIIFSGARLSKYGDIIAGLTGLGKAWFGLILMAAVTSLPELITSISSILIFDTPDIAVGNLMGSLSYNMLILAVLDYFVRGKPLCAAVTKSHVLAIFFGMALITTAVTGLVFSNQFPMVLWVGFSSLLLIIFYLFAIYILFQNEKRQPQIAAAVQVQPPTEAAPLISLKVATRRYIFFALLVITGALLLPYFADRLSAAAGLSQSFVGTIMVAASTTLPELVVSIAAVRLGSLDIAVGNLVGSNIFNMLILAFDDVLYSKGPLMQAVDPGHALSGLVALLMMAVAGSSIFYGPTTKRFILGGDAILLIVLYLLLLVSLLQFG